MDITNTIRKYAECASGGAITEPTGGSWISALAIWQGSTEPLNSSWLQTVCDNYGITQPVDGSWLIALANYYGVFAPVNGSWSYAVQTGCEAGPPAPIELIWDQTSTEWQLEEAAWAIAIAPMTPTFDQDGDSIELGTPTLTGTSDPLVQIDLNVNGDMYQTVADAVGNWSITTNALTGATSPGIEYTITIIAKDINNGLISAEFQGNIFIISNFVDVTFEMGSTWSVWWYIHGIMLEQEISTGVWEAIEYNGNPTLGNGANFYKEYSKYSGTPPALRPYVMNVQSDDDEYRPASLQQTDIVNRTVTVPAGGNYRIKQVSSGSSFGNYVYYTVYVEGIEILPRYQTAAIPFWENNYIQQTFTL